jgi:hypothetical protein
MSDKKSGKPENLKPWKSGESGNPAGRPPVPEEIKKLRKLSNDELQDIGDMLLFGTKADLIEVTESEDTPVLKLWMARLILDAVDKKNGSSIDVLEAFLDRLIGKTPISSKVDVTARTPLAMVVEMIKRLESE